MSWDFGWKILNPDRTSPWATSQELLRPGALTYPRLMAVRPLAGMGPLAVFADTDRAHAYWHYLRRCANVYDPQWQRAMIVEIVFERSCQTRFHVNGYCESLPSRGTQFADCVICLE